MTTQTVWLTISLWQVRRLVPMRSVLRGVAMASWVLPSDSLCLKTVILTGWVKPTVPTPCCTSRVGVRQRLFAETSLKDRPKHKHTQTHTVLISLFYEIHMLGLLLFILSSKDWERIKQMIIITKLILEHNKHPKWVSVLLHMGSQYDREEPGHKDESKQDWI